VLQDVAIGLLFGDIDELLKAEGGETGVELRIIASVMIGQPEPGSDLTGYHFIVIFLSEFRDSFSIDGYLGLWILL